MIHARAGAERVRVASSSTHANQIARVRPSRPCTHRYFPVDGSHDCSGVHRKDPRCPALAWMRRKRARLDSARRGRALLAEPAEIRYPVSRKLGIFGHDGTWVERGAGIGDDSVRCIFFGSYAGIMVLEQIMRV